MGLVDYSESDDSGSETEQPQKPVAKAQPSQTKKSIQKLVDPSNPGKIIINLPQAKGHSAATASENDQPPTKRAKTTGSGLFSGFNSFLPPPKNTGVTPATKAFSSTSRAPGIGLRTSSAAAFDRGDGVSDIYNEAPAVDGGLFLPPPKRDEPSIPEGQKPASEVKLTGKPLMFKPLSVARSKKKKTTKATAAKATAAAASQPATAVTSATPTAPSLPPKKASLFSMHTEEASEPASASNGTYEPLFEADNSHSAGVTSSYEEYAASYAQPAQAASAGPSTDSLGNIADDLNLSAAERRELFGRGGSAQLSAKKVVNFNMDEEYKHNETVRASGDTQIHNPVRAIQGGKHSLRQLVQNVHNQREALEDSFAKGKGNRKEASGRYGW